MLAGWVSGRMDARGCSSHIPREVARAVLGTQEAEDGRERRGRRAARELFAARHQEAEKEERHARSVDEDGEHGRRAHGIVRGGRRGESSLLSPCAAAQRVVDAQPELTVVEALAVKGLYRAEIVST
mgnify:CR=1 FL=1